jgi:hypothetical protein
MRVIRAIGLLLISISGVGCGTAVYTHQIEVTIQDPSGRLVAGPVDVSIFDKYMGYSEEWARRTMAAATASAPYVGTVNTMPVKWFWDSTLPPNVIAGLVVPAIEKNGYFVVDINLVHGVAQSASAPFAPWGAFFPDSTSTVPPLPVRYQGERGDKGWRIRLTVDVPAKP